MASGAPGPGVVKDFTAACLINLYIARKYTQLRFEMERDNDGFGRRSRIRRVQVYKDW